MILSHYPVFCYNGQNRLTAEGEPRSVMLYGHLHDTFDEVLVNRFIAETRAAKRPQRDRETGEILEKDIPCLMINCFCMFSEYRPLGLLEWIALDRARRLSALQRDSR